MARVLLTCLLLLTLGHPGPATAATEPRGVWPLQPEPSVERGFEPPSADWLAGHRGVDLAGQPGQWVRSALDGQVGFVGVVGGKPVVTVLHGGRRTTYEPVEGTVERGEAVGAGDPIGRLVTRAGHCFPDTCLHWGLRDGDTYLDPLSLVGSATVRLLPLWRAEPAPPRPRRPATAQAQAPLPLPLPLLADWLPPLALMGGPQLRRVDEPADRPVSSDQW